MESEKRIAELEKTSAALTEYIKYVNGTISSVFEKVNKNFETITVHLQAIDKELNLLNAKVDKLNIGTEKGFGKVDVKLEDIRTEILKINDITGYDGMFDNSKLLEKQKGEA